MGHKLSCCRLKWVNGSILDVPPGHPQNGQGHYREEKYRIANGPPGPLPPLVGGSYNNAGGMVGLRNYNEMTPYPMTSLWGVTSSGFEGGFDNSWMQGEGSRPVSYLNMGSGSEEKLHHISEREPDDLEQDPSTNPTKQTIFLRRSKKAIEMSYKKRYSVYDRRACSRYLSKHIRMYSSCSSILLDDCTVSQPNGKACLKALALAIYFHIRNREALSLSDNDLEILDVFDEKLHPISKESVPHDYANKNPDQREIYRFIRNLFTMAQLTAECTVVTLVYIERLLTYAEIDLKPATWRRQVLAAILLASKVWDDQAVWNVDYCNILKDLDVQDVNDLERRYLELIQFNINIPPSVYAKYYFDLLSLAEAHGLYNSPETRRPLSRDRARKLEALNLASQLLTPDQLEADAKQGAKSTLCRFPSLDGFFATPRFRRAIIS